MSKANADWESPTSHKTHIIHGFDVGINLFNSIVPNDVTITKSKMTATLPDLSLAFSLAKYKQILSITSTIDPMVHLHNVAADDEVEFESNNSVDKGEQVDLGLARVGAAVEKTQDSLAKRVVVDCKFTLNKLMFVIMTDEDSIEIPDYSCGKNKQLESGLLNMMSNGPKPEGMPLVVFALFDVDLHLLQRTFDKDIAFYVHAMFLEDCIQRSSQHYKYLIMSHNPREVSPSLPHIPLPEANVGTSNHLIEIAVRLIGNKSPFYEKIDKSIALTSHTLHVNCNRETIAYLMALGKAFAASQPVKHDPAVDRAAAMTAQALSDNGGSKHGSRHGSVSSAVSRPRGSISSRTSQRSQRSRAASAVIKPKAAIDDTVVKLKLSLAVAGLSLSLNEVIEGSTLLTCLLVGLRTDLQMYPRSMMCNGKIGRVLLSFFVMLCLAGCY